MRKNPETLETYPLLVENFPKVSEDGLIYTFHRFLISAPSAHDLAGGYERGRAGNNISLPK